jgi:hypothetical protein
MYFINIVKNTTTIIILLIKRSQNKCLKNRESTVYMMRNKTTIAITYLIFCSTIFNHSLTIANTIKKFIIVLTNSS